MQNWVMITGSITSRPLYPRKIDPRYPLNRRILEQVCMFWVKFCCPCWVQNPASPISQSRHFNDSTILAPNNIYLYIYIYIYIHLFNSEIALQSDSKNFSVIFEMTHIHISAHRSLLFMKAQVYFTPWGKCQDTGITSLKQLQETIRSTLLLGSFYLLYMYSNLSCVYYC